MKRKNIFPLLAGIFLIYLLCRFTYQGGNQEGFIEGFLQGAQAADPSVPNNKCTETTINKKTLNCRHILKEVFIKTKTDDALMLKETCESVPIPLSDSFREEPAAKHYKHVGSR